MQSSRDHLVPNGANISTPNFDSVVPPTIIVIVPATSLDPRGSTTCGTVFRGAQPHRQQFVRQTNNGN
jgi:hypothetical protein